MYINTEYINIMTAATTKVLSTMSGMASNRSLMDENSKTLDATTVASMKVYAPSSDRRLVLAAIDNQVNASKVAWRESNSDGQSNAAREKFFLNCIDQTGAFIKRQVELLTMSMDEAAVEDVLDSFRTRRLANTRSSSPLMADDENCDDDSLSSDDDENEEFEYDDADIVDQDAYNQVKQLRSQAREISSRVRAIRTETVDRAMDMTQRNLTDFMRVHGFEENADTNQTQEDSEKLADTNNEMRSDVLNQLHIALRTLASSRHYVDSNLPDNHDSLKQTIGTIESSMEKLQRLAQGDESVLSQTEKAIITSGHQEEDTTVVESVHESDCMMNPDKKLAHLLAGML